MLAKDLRKKTKEELQILAEETRKKLMVERASALTGESADLQKIRTLKQDYARMRTVLNEKGKENA